MHSASSTSRQVPGGQVTRRSVLALATIGLLAAAPASASLIGTTASTASNFTPGPASATVRDGGAPEFVYSLFFIGDVGADSFTLTSPGSKGEFGNLFGPGNEISLTLAKTITGITVTIGTSIPTLPSSVFSFSDKTLTIALGAAGPYEGGSLVATVAFTFAGTPVPEPTSIALLGAGLLGLGAAARRRRG